MTWSVSASGTVAQVKQKVREQVAGSHSRVADLLEQLVECHAADVRDQVSLSGSGSPRGGFDSGNVSLSISVTKAPAPAKP